MSKYTDFTVDKQKFPSLDVFANTLHSNNQHIIPIIDAAISADDLNNKYY
jgi:alpha-glucosidase (family GH31 glycosyl hydrolase)